MNDIWDPKKSMNPESNVDTGLLVSVRNLAEASTVLKHRVQILDFKEPNAGALGAVDAALLEGFVELASEENGGPMFSFAAGELIDANKNLIDQYSTTVLHCFDYVKIGLAGCAELPDWQDRWRAYFSGTVNASPVMVAYFDHQSCKAPPIDACLELAEQVGGCETILLDTFYKTHDLFASIDLQSLKAFASRVRDAKLKLVVAGSVSTSSLAKVLSAGPDFVGVRGAVCNGSRAGSIDPAKVQKLVAALANASTYS